MSREKIDRALAGQTAALKELFRKPENLDSFIVCLVEHFHGGGKLIVAASARLSPVADLVANLFLHRLSLERPLLPAVSLCHDFSLGRTLERDGQGNQVLSRQFRAVASEGDILLVFGDVLRDEGVAELLNTAREEGCPTAAILAKSDRDGMEKPDYLFPLETDSSARAAEASLFFGHLLCELVEGEIFGT